MKYQADTDFDSVSSCVAVTEASLQLTVVLVMGGSDIASSIQPGPCSISNTNTTDLITITNMTSIDNGVLEDRSTIAEGAMSRGGLERFYRTDCGCPLCDFVLRSVDKIQ